MVHRLDFLLSCVEFRERAQPLTLWATGLREITYCGELTVAPAFWFSYAFEDNRPTVYLDANAMTSLRNEVTVR